MEPIVSSETSAIRTQMPGNYPKRNKLQVRKLSTKMLEFLPLYCAYAWTESKDILFYMCDESALSAVQFTVPGLLDFTFHKILELWYRWKPWGLREWTVGPFTEPCVLLQNAGTVQYKLLQLLFAFSDSKSVFMSYYIIMCNWYGVSSENFVVMQGHWGISFQFLLQDSESC